MQNECLDGIPLKYKKAKQLIFYRNLIKIFEKVPYSIQGQVQKMTSNFFPKMTLDQYSPLQYTT